MKLKLIILFFFFLFHCEIFAQVVNFVDPFIGVDRGGNVFPGACLPFGMVKLGPDMTMNHAYANPNSGYASKQKVYGFSHTHVSGTGGGAKYGNIRVVPFLGEPNKLDYRTTLSNEKAYPGYFGCKLPDLEIGVELTSTHSVGFHRYTFQESTNSGLMIDASAMLLRGSEFQYLENSEIEILSDTGMAGWSKIGGGWNCGKPYTVFFYAVFDTPADTFGTWKNRRLEYGSKSEKLTVRYDKITENNTATGAFFLYKTKAGQQVQLKVGISFVSIEKAKENLIHEGQRWNFDRIRSEATAQWERMLNRIKIDGISDQEKTVFYTAVYHSLLMPTNRTGEYPGWDTSKVYYDDYYAMWDTYRTVHPLLTLISESRQVEMINSLLNIGNAEGFMPDGRSGNSNGRTQGGSNCDILIADAFVKGLKGIDYENAFQLMVKNAEVEPENTRKEGRGGINEYKQMGYVPSEIERAGTRTMEYSFCDYALSVVADGLGKKLDAQKYRTRASNWTNLWNPVGQLGAIGFIWPKTSEGNWKLDFDPKKWGSWTDFFYESHSWEYSLSVPHDVRKLVELSGGKVKFEARLDTFFQKGFYLVENEPGFLTPCLYHWTSKPYKSAERVSLIRDKFFKATRGGIPGNDDSGAMSAWYAFHAMGFYPVAGTNVYLINSPKFPSVEIKLENGESLKIAAKNSGNGNIYIQKATLNGKKIDRSWFTHDEIKDGATFEFVMGPKPSQWAVSSAIPPSLSDYTNSKL